MAQLKVAVLDDYQSVARSSSNWDRLDCTVTFFHDHLGDATVAELADFDVIVAMRERTPFDRDRLESLPHLKLLVTTGGRNASIDVAAAGRLGVTVCGTRSPGHATAELAFGLIQMLARGLFDEIGGFREGGWQIGIGRDLLGSRLGVIGLGRLGSRVAAYGLAFGMDVIAWSANLTDERAGQVGVRRVSMSELLSTSDFVTLHVRLSERTRRLIGDRELALMKPSAYLINTSRGPVVDEAALLEAVRSGRIAGAGVDVFEEEPLPADHPFRSEPRIVATPHIGYVTEETYAIFYADVVEDIEAWMAGSPVRVLGEPST